MIREHPFYKKKFVKPPKKLIRRSSHNLEIWQRKQNFLKNLKLDLQKLNMTEDQIKIFLESAAKRYESTR